MIPKFKIPGTRGKHHPDLMHGEAEASPSGTTHGTSHVKPGSVCWSAHRQHDAWFLLFVLLLAGGTILALSSIGTALQKQASVTQPGAPPTVPTSATGGTPAPTAVAVVHAARSRLYRVPSANVGLMQPAVDTQENVWVGEMYANRFARLDSQTGVVTTWEPPDAKYGIMTTTVDAHGNPWFVEQGANYIGRFDPVRQTFRIFPLGTVNGRPMGPQALQFDASGKLWFTAVTAGRIGRLDPTTGAIQTWPVPPPTTGILPYPFSLTVTPAGQVWFGLLSGGAVGHLDPTTGRVRLYHLTDPQAQIFSMTSDPRGRIWFTEIVPGKLGMLDPTTNRVSELSVPTIAGHPAALYGIVVTHNGEVWFANNGANALVRYSPGNPTFTFFQLSLPSSGLYGLTLDKASRLWFTASGQSANYVGEMTP